ncbi:MAG: hypothetical protein NTZ82_00635 [Bacteroidetes bacterium]|nr:hypothetical protein [Bacteroidota bacterium]
MKQLLILSFAFLAITGCRKIETDGEKEIVIVNQPVIPSGPTANTVTLSGRITKDTTLYAKDFNYLQGLVYITKGVTLTVQEGATVKGKYSGSDVSALIICRGAKLIAKGTVDKPIVFTSASANPQSGDWGGIVLCGTAPINTSFTVNGSAVTGLYQVEGGVDNANGDGLAGAGDAAFPTVNPADNSGILQYLRIEYAGYAYQPDKEINSLTMAAVGSGTTIDHIETAFGKDDSFEWFGGTVNCKYLIAYKGQDDDFDTDNGYSGYVQFGIGIRDSLIADISKSEAFESDNNATGTTATPKTTAVFSNMTVVGPRATLSNIGNSLFLAGAQIRRNSGISIQNSIFMGWPTGLLIDAGLGSPTDLNIADSTTIRFKNNTFAGNTVNVKYTKSTSAPTGADDATMLAWVSNPGYGNAITTNAVDAKLIQPFNYTMFDPTPYAGTAAPATANLTLGVAGNFNYASNGSFTDSKLQDAFIKKVAFRGAIGLNGEDATWWKGWARFNY